MFIAKRDFFTKTFTNCADPASFWKALNRFAGRKQHSEIPTLKTSDGMEKSKSQEKAELLRQQFESVFLPSNDTYNVQDTDSYCYMQSASVELILHKIAKLPIPALVIKNVP